ncbi:MAG: hypothetical protein D6766_11995 [Verrucomicrobia bacterium]|nr:MAG: hypothetical protein D6766_11995 [Verrucomicrobiota bacterium]
MFGTIRKHSTWLWGIIIAATIVSFVIFFTPTSRRGGAIRGARTYGTMNGRPIPVERFQQAALEVQLSFFLRFGRFPDDVNARQMGFDLDQEARNRLVLLSQIEALDIEVSDQAVAEWVLRNFGSPGQPETARANYRQFVERMEQRRIPPEDITRFIKHEIAIDHMFDVVGAAGALVTPREAARQYRIANERIQAEALRIMATNFLDKVQVTPEAVAEFYTNRMAMYRTPEKVAVYYVRFPASNYVAQAEAELAKITNLTERLDALYQQRGANAFLDTNGQVLPPEQAKLKLREEERDRLALVIARREAAKFGTELFEKEPMAVTNLFVLAEAKGLKVQSTQPFTERATAPIPGVARNFVEIAFKLGPDRPFSAPLVGEDAVDLIAFKERIPSTVPPLEEIRARVTEDFRREEARRLAVEEGRKLVEQLRQALKEGKPFANAVFETGHGWIRLPRFSRSSRNVPGWPAYLPFSRVVSVAAELKEGELSDFIPLADGGVAIYVRKREPVDEEELKAALPDQLARMQDQGRMAAFREWLARRIEVSDIRFPSDQVQASQGQETSDSGGQDSGQSAPANP